MSFDLKSRAQMLARDPNVFIEGKPVPVLTTLIYRFCDNDPDKFEQLCDLIGIIQDKTIDLIKKEGIPND